MTYSQTFWKLLFSSDTPIPVWSRKSILIMLAVGFGVVGSIALCDFMESNKTVMDRAVEAEGYSFAVCVESELDLEGYRINLVGDARRDLGLEKVGALYCAVVWNSYNDRTFSMAPGNNSPRGPFPFDEIRVYYLSTGVMRQVTVSVAIPLNKDTGKFDFRIVGIIEDDIPIIYTHKIQPDSPLVLPN